MALAALRSYLARTIAPKQKSIGQAAAESVSTGSVFVDRTAAAGLEAFAKSSALNSVVMKIAESIAAIDWTLSVAKEEGKPKRAKQLQRARTYDERKRLEKQTTLEPIDEHAILTVLDKGNSLLNGFTVMQLFQAYLDLVGEAFLIKDRDAFNVVESLWIVPPSWVVNIPNARVPLFEVSINGLRRFYFPEDVVWLKNPDPRNPYGRGLGQTMVLANELVTDEYAAEFIQAFFYNGAKPDAVIGFDGAGDDMVKAMKEAWNADHRGARKSHQVRFVNYKPEVVTLETRFRDRDIVSLREHYAAMVRQQYGVPPEIMGILNDSNRATITQAETIFARWVLVPRAMRIQLALQTQLVNEIDPLLILGFVSPVPADKDFTLKAMEASRDSFTRADWRRLAGAEVTDEDEVYLFDPPKVIVPRDEANGGVVGVPLDPGGVDTKALIKIKSANNDIDAIISEMDSVKLSEGAPELWAPEMQTLYGETVVGLGADANSVMQREAVAKNISNLVNIQLDGFAEATTRRELRAALVEGVSAGEGALEITERVNAVFDFSDKVRAELIARTEVASSANYTSYTAQKDSGLVTKREWISVGDKRTRDTHLPPTDGQIVGINDLFQVGNSQGPYPGAIDDASENMRCRCTTVAVFQLDAALLAVTKGQQLDDETRIKVAETFADAFDLRNQPWIDAAETHFQSQFAAQRALVLEAVNRILPQY